MGRRPALRAAMTATTVAVIAAPVCRRPSRPSRPRWKAAVAFVVVLGLAVEVAPSSNRVDAAQGSSSGRARPDARDLVRVDPPMTFEENRGQVDEGVDYVARSNGYRVFLTGGDAVVALGNGKSGFAVRMEVLGGAVDPQAIARDPQPGKVNYFVGNDPGEWQTNVPTYAAVEYQGVYSGIDLRYVGNDRQLQYDFIVQPGADPSQIALGFDGSRHLALSDDGDLEVGLNPGRTITFSAPVAYQDIEGQRLPVDSAYVLTDDSVSFTIGDYDSAYPLVIDPTLEYGSYLGGTGDDAGTGISVDGSGNIIVAGYTASSNFPTTVGAYDTSANGSNDVAVAKFDPTGATLQWATYIGGSGLDNAEGVAVDSTGAVYVGVYTASSNFPTTAGAYDITLGGLYDGAVLKLSANGSSLVYSTYLGGSGNNDFLRAIAVDASGQAVVAGATDSSNYPTVAGSYDRTFGGSFDAFATKLNAAGTGLVWSTFLGGTGSDSIDDLVLDGSGIVYATGQAATGYPTTAGAYDTTLSGTTDGHATKLSANGSSLLYATYFGGTGSDIGKAIDVSDANTLYVAGNTPSSDFPTTAGAYDTSKAASDDMFALKLDLTQTGAAQLSYSTFIGGAGFDRVNGIDVDTYGRAHVAGWTQSSGLATSGAYDTTFSGTSDGVLAILSASGTAMQELTYVGGADYDSADDIALAGSSIYLTGNTSSATGFPITGGAYDSGLSGTSDGFVVKFAQLGPPPNPAIVTVNSTGNGSDNNAGNGVCNTGGTVAGSPECTLRAAIQEANASGVVNTIHFNIPITDGGYTASPVAFRIRPSGSVLPDITGPVVLDATTQPEFGAAGRPVIVLDGSLAPMTGDPNGISLNAGSSTIRGLVIQNFGEDGIEIDVNGGNLIVGNYIGTDVTGTLARPNGVMDLFPVGGISIKTSNNTIGGAAAADRNVISGNTQFGIAVRSGGSNNIIRGNYIGTNALGNAMVPNQDPGIYLDTGSNGNTIGGSGAGEGNVISGNNTTNTATSAGVYVLSSSNTIRGNLIGTDSGGTTNLRNDGAGITLASGAANNVVGGTVGRRRQHDRLQQGRRCAPHDGRRQRQLDPRQLDPQQRRPGPRHRPQQRLVQRQRRRGCRLRPERPSELPGHDVRRGDGWNCDGDVRPRCTRRELPGRVLPQHGGRRVGIRGGRDVRVRCDRNPGHGQNAHLRRLIRGHHHRNRHSRPGRRFVWVDVRVLGDPNGLIVDGHLGELDGELVRQQPGQRGLQHGWHDRRQRRMHTAGRDPGGERLGDHRHHPLRHPRGSRRGCPHDCTVSGSAPDDHGDGRHRRNDGARLRRHACRRARWVFRLRSGTRTRYRKRRLPHLRALHPLVPGRRPVGGYGLEHHRR